MTAGDFFWTGVLLALGVIGFFLTVALVVAVAYGLVLAIAFPIIVIHDIFQKRNKK